MTYYFLGVFCAFIITIALILDLERKRNMMAHIGARLEELTKGNIRSRVRHIRRLSLSLFMYEQVVQQMHEQIAEFEEENGLTPPELPGRGLPFLSEKRLEQMEERVEQLAGVIGE